MYRWFPLFFQQVNTICNKKKTNTNNIPFIKIGRTRYVVAHY